MITNANPNANNSGNPKERAIALLNQALAIEYSMIIHFPRLAVLINDEDLKNRITALMTDSYKHSQVVASAIEYLGGTAKWVNEEFPLGIGVVGFLQKQLENERTAMQLHQQSASLFAPDSSLNQTFNEMAKQEEFHIRTVEYIISKLK